MQTVHLRSNPKLFNGSLRTTLFSRLKTCEDDNIKHVRMTIYCAGTSMSLLALIWWSYQHIYLYCDRNLCFLKILVLDETVIIHALFKKYTEQQQQQKTVLGDCERPSALLSGQEGRGEQVFIFFGRDKEGWQKTNIVDLLQNPETPFVMRAFNKLCTELCWLAFWLMMKMPVSMKHC